MFFEVLANSVEVSRSRIGGHCAVLAIRRIGDCGRAKRDRTSEARAERSHQRGESRAIAPARREPSDRTSEARAERSHQRGESRAIAPARREPSDRTSEAEPSDRTSEAEPSDRTSEAQPSAAPARRVERQDY